MPTGKTVVGVRDLLGAVRAAQPDFQQLRERRGNDHQSRTEVVA
ncbi:hypothetical protein [Kibdelosporangium philippinense]|nr:hypothetical protein [Kibdelosporangium philippinense]